MVIALLVATLSIPVDLISLKEEQCALARGSLVSLPNVSSWLRLGSLRQDSIFSRAHWQITQS